MSAFSRRFSKVLESRNLKGKELSEALGVSSSQISRWAGGKSLPDRNGLQRLTRELPEDAADLVAAWVRDHCAPEVTHLISIEPREEGMNLRDEEVSYDAWPRGMSEVTKRKFLDFARLADGNPDVMEIVEILHGAARRSLELIHERRYGKGE
ncbi:MAG: helix-turn-helix transcriptional regulator [Luteolibacter sp.]